MNKNAKLGSPVCVCKRSVYIDCNVLDQTKINWITTDQI